MKPWVFLLVLVVLLVSSAGAEARSQPMDPAGCGTMAIRLNDNLLERCSHAEIEAVRAPKIDLGTPLLNTYIRVNEAEADLFGLHAAGQPEGFAEVALKLGEYRKLDPGPIEEWIFFDHPSGRARIEMAMRWKAEHQENLP